MSIDAPTQVSPQAGFERYRQCVFSVGRGADPPDDLDDVLVDSGRLSADFQRDVQRFRHRLQAAEIIATPPGQLPAEIEADRLLAEAADEPESPEAIQAMKLADVETVGQMYIFIRRLMEPHNAAYQHPARMRARELQRAAASTRAEARRTLVETGDPKLRARTGALLREVQTLERQISERQEILDSPVTLKRLRTKAEELVRQADPVALGRIRQAMKHVQGLVPQRKAALKANGADQATIGKLKRERVKLQDEVRRPECMAFSEV